MEINPHTIALVKQRLDELNKKKRTAEKEERIDIEAQIHILTKQAKELEEELQRVQRRIGESE